MGGAVEAIADIGGDVLGSALDVGSIVTDLGQEFLTPEALGVAGVAFGIPGPDVFNLGGFDLAGSFAGDAGWFNTFNPGAILDNIPSVSDFSLPSLPGLPSLPSLNTPNLVSAASSSFGVNPSLASSVVRTLGNPSIVATGAAALGINPAIASTATNLLNGGSPVAAGAAALGINPAIASTVYNPTYQPGSVVATNGVVGGVLRELSVEETLELERRNINPLFLNSLVDPGINQSQNYNAAVQTRDSLTPVVENLQIRVDEARELISQENENIIRYQNELDNPDLTDEERAALEANIQVSYDYIARSQQVINNNEPLIISTSEEIARAEQVIASTNLSATTSPAPVGAVRTTPQYTAVYDPETGTWSVFNNDTSTTVRTGLTEQQAILAEQDLNITSGVTLSAVASPVNLGSVTATDLDLAVDPGPFAEGSSARNLVAEARAQQSARAVRNNKAESSDWRVRLRLAPNSTYLYNAPGNPGDPASGPGIMAPLAKTDGVIFPYTPAIDTAYKANYEAYDLTHSNYRGYFYKGSYVDAVNIRAQFTAQDTNEANYLLAVIHFFRSATKMFYGRDTAPAAGSPPPLVYLSGYGDYQFNEHPSVISQFNYTLPPDVDYIRAQNALDVNTNALGNRIRNPIANNPLSYTVNRLFNNKLLPGALDFRPNISNNLPVGSPTYVPTKMEISITLLPIQSRQQISKNFSVKTFAAGNLLKGGYW